MRYRRVKPYKGRKRSWWDRHERTPIEKDDLSWYQDVLAKRSESLLANPTLPAYPLLGRRATLENGTRILLRRLTKDEAKGLDLRASMFQSWPHTMPEPVRRDDVMIDVTKKPDSKGNID